MFPVKLYCDHISNVKSAQLRSFHVKSTYKRQTFTLLHNLNFILALPHMKLSMNIKYTLRQQCLTMFHLSLVFESRHAHVETNWATKCQFLSLRNCISLQLHYQGFLCSGRKGQRGGDSWRGVETSEEGMREGRQDWELKEGRQVGGSGGKEEDWKEM